MLDGDWSSDVCSSDLLLVPLSQQDQERVEAYLDSNTVRLDAGRFEGGKRDDDPERG
jgi:hypothetical protein